jgi:hypothetical protein
MRARADGYRLRFVVIIDVADGLGREDNWQLLVIASAGRRSIRLGESDPTREYLARLLMIIRNASNTALLTYGNSTGQRPMIANDRPEPTPASCRVRKIMRKSR